MINSVKARTPILALILFVFAVGSAIAQNKVVVIPMGGDDVPKEALPLAYGYITDSIVATGYNVASATNSATGFYEVTLDNGFSGHPIVTATAFNLSFDTEIVTYEFEDQNKIIFRIVNESNVAVNSYFSFVVHGTPL